MYSIKRHKTVFLVVLLTSVMGILAGTGMAQQKHHYWQIPVVNGTHGAVASGSPIASQMGLKVLMDGGNAVDAAVTTATMLSVGDSNMCGIGGHGIMMLYWAKTGEVKCLDWGGFLPHKFTVDQWGTPPEIPTRDPQCSILPGTLAGWAEALDKYGTISLAKALEPAIKYAEEGVPLIPTLAVYTENRADLIKVFPELAKIYMPGGRVPKMGDMLKFKDLANTYRKIAKEGPEVFYKGELGDRIVKYLNEHGSRFTKEEFANYKPIWRDTLSTAYRDRYEVFVPKNQNFSPTILTMLNIWENFDMKSLGLLSPETIHLVIEAMKIALADRTAYYGDPAFTEIPYEILTSKAYAKRLVQERIDMQKASPDKPGEIEGLEGATTNLAVVDKDHNVCCITQTLGSGFGCCHVVPGTGIILNNEGQFFDLEPVGGPNYPGAGKRVENQMGPAIVLKDGKIFMGVGTPGGTMIPLAIAEVIMRAIDYDLGIQEAIEVPRIRYRGKGIAQLEEGIPWEVREKLWQMGHYIQDATSICRVTAVTVDPESGIVEGGADSDGNCIAVAY